MGKTVYYPFYCVDPITTESGDGTEKYDQKKDLLVELAADKRFITLLWGSDTRDDFISMLKKSESPCLIPLSFIVDKGFKI